MSTDVGNTARLVELQVADDPACWEAAGFAADVDSVTLGATLIRLLGRPEGGRRGIVGWTVSGLVSADGEGDIDGIATTFTGPSAQTGDAPAPTTEHPNGATGLDHVVIVTPDVDRTTAAFGDLGLAVRRIRETTSYGSPMRQAFLRLGPTILEVVGPHDGSGQTAAEAPAGWFGLAIDVTDLDRTADLLGDGLGEVKPAVQEGRRIGTLRHRQLGMSVSIAFMDDHG